MSKIRVLTTNLFFNADSAHLSDLVAREQPDIIALQEFCTTDKELKKLEELTGYSVAGFSHNYIKKNVPYGICTVYKSSTLKVKKHFESRLSIGISEFFIMLFRGRKSRSVMHTIFSTTDKKEVSFVNVHLSPYGSNAIRKKQLSLILEKYCSGNRSTVIAGDFNFPYRRLHLEELVSKYHFKEATDGIRFTFVKKWIGIITIRFKLDYVFYRACTHIRTERLSRVLSDHYPLISEFDL
jgi:endonuclease/exonuclease/phosphatase (EEP) superfamily protein YafD